MQAFRSLSRAALVAAACAISLQAQCLDSNTGASIGGGDDIVLPAQTLPFAFPFNGNTYTTIHPCTNGFVYLSNGTTTGGALCCTGNTTALAAATSPMIAPFWTDLNMVVASGGAVKVSSTASKVVVTWENAIEYSTAATLQFSVQLWMSPAGDFTFVYDSRVQNRRPSTILVGMSPGAGATIPAATDFSTVGIGATNTNFQLFTTLGAISLSGAKVDFLPTAPGFVWNPGNCAATHTSYGTGCYSIPATCGYQSFADAVAAQAGLQGNAMLLAPSGSGYLASWLPGAGAALYVAPTVAATSLATNDDGDDVFTPTTGFPTPGGIASQLTISHNGIVTLGGVGNNSLDYTPTGPELAGALNNAAAFYVGWHDWYDAEATSTGRIKTEEVGSVIYITWDNVDNYPTGVLNPGTMQIQLDRSSGVVTYVWTAIDPSTASTFGTAYVVGFRGAGPVADPGSVNFATALPASYTQVPVQPLALGAAPAPISTPSTGSVVTYTTSNIPELTPGSGLYVALSIISLGQVPAPGLDLSFIGAPGCAALVQSLDFTQSMVGLTSSQTVTLTIPAGVPAGTFLYSQSAALITPNSLPNGQNAFGLTTSNGVASRIDVQ